MFERSGRTARRHASEEVLLAYADGEPALPAGAREHIADCAVCERRGLELRRMRHLLQAAAQQPTPPPHDVTRGALNRLRQRRAAIGHVNELFGVLAALLRGFSTLLAGDKTPSEPPPEQRDRMTTRG